MAITGVSGCRMLMTSGYDTVRDVLSVIDLTRRKKSNSLIRTESLTIRKRQPGVQRKLLSRTRSEFPQVASGESKLARDDLLGLVAGEERGLRSQENLRKRDQILKVIDTLGALGAGSITTDKSLTGAWRLLWTTEKEQLYIIDKLAPFFGTRAGDIFQVIDVEKKTLNNVITFPPTGVFGVHSTIDIVTAQRAHFRFIGASLLVGGFKIPIPPFGQGWFESTYMDEKIRVSKDIRGDYLVVDRARWAPKFSN